MTYQPTMTDAELDELKVRARGMTRDELTILGDRLVEAGAPGQAFEMIHRAGWRPRSQTDRSVGHIPILHEGETERCGPDCKICDPDPVFKYQGRKKR